MDPWDDVSPPDDSFSLMQNQGSSFCKAFREREEFYFKHKSDENSMVLQSKIVPNDISDEKLHR